MSSTESVLRRISGLGRFLVDCQAQTLQYGNCVSRKESITKYACDKEFQALKHCMKEAAKKAKP